MRRKRDEILRTWEVRDPNFGRCGTFCSIENSKFNAWTAYRMHYSENDNSLITVLISRKLTFSRIDVKGSKSVNKYKNSFKNLLKFIFYLFTGGSLKWPIIVGPGSMWRMIFACWSNKFILGFFRFKIDDVIFPPDTPLFQNLQIPYFSIWFWKKECFWVISKSLPY